MSGSRRAFLALLASLGSSAAGYVALKHRSGSGPALGGGGDPSTLSPGYGDSYQNNYGGDY